MCKWWLPSTPLFSNLHDILLNETIDWFFPFHKYYSLGKWLIHTVSLALRFDSTFSTMTSCLKLPLPCYLLFLRLFYTYLPPFFCHGCNSHDFDMRSQQSSFCIAVDWASGFGMDGWWGRWKYAWTHPSAWLSFLWTGWIDWWNGRNEFLWIILMFSTGHCGDFSLVCLHDGRAYRRMEKSGLMAVPHFAVYSYFPYHDEWIWAGVFSPYRYTRAPKLKLHFALVSGWLTCLSNFRA